MDQYMHAIIKRLANIEQDSTQNYDCKMLLSNIQNFCQVYLPLLPEKARIASVLTAGLSLADAAEITSLPPSTIHWGRNEIEEGRLFQSNVRGGKKSYFYYFKRILTLQYKLLVQSAVTKKSFE
jgi:hypothetical protein